MKITEELGWDKGGRGSTGSYRWRSREKFGNCGSAKGAKIVAAGENEVSELRETMYDGRVGSDSKLAEVANFRKYENGLLGRRCDFGGNRRFSRGSAFEFQTATNTKSANRLLERSTGGK